MRTFRDLIFCCVMLLVICLMGCKTTQTTVAYEGPRLQQNRAVLLNLQQSSFGVPASQVAKIYIKMIDDRNDPKWAGSPDSIELLPGNHKLYLEAFFPSSQPGLRPRYIGEATVVFDAEAGHEYDLKYNHLSSGDGFLRCKIVDWTRGGMVVYPQTQEPKPFIFSEVPKDKAVVCFYREWKMLSAVVDFYVSEKNQDIRILPNGTLFYHVTTPGSHTFAIGFSGKGKSTHVELLPGVITYLRASVFSGQLSPVQEAEALKETRGLKGL